MGVGAVKVSIKVGTVQVYRTAEVTARTGVISRQGRQCEDVTSRTNRSSCPGKQISISNVECECSGSTTSAFLESAQTSSSADCAKLSHKIGGVIRQMPSDQWPSATLSAITWTGGMKFE